MSAVRTLEGYFKEGSFYTYEPVINMPSNSRVLITILENIPQYKQDTWDDFDKLVDSIDEKLKFDDFPRSDLSRPLVNFDEV